MTPEQVVGKAGARLFVILFGDKHDDDLNYLRYVKFLEMVYQQVKLFTPQKLRPTKRAAHFHGLRVHLKVMLWKRLKHQDLEFDPEQWGWKLDGTQPSPTMTDLAAGPEALLQFFWCKCKLSSNTCSCRNNGSM